jgi:glutamate synthase (NADPH/NADH) small chain
MRRRTEGDARQRVRDRLRSRAAGPGFPRPEADTIVGQLGCALTERGNLQPGPDYQTTVPGVCACSDARRGQSLVVRSIWDGREAARGVDAYLMGETVLPASPDL